MYHFTQESKVLKHTVVVNGK